jgi:hypothetical protein
VEIAQLHSGRILGKDTRQSQFSIKFCHLKHKTKDWESIEEGFKCPIKGNNKIRMI